MVRKTADHLLRIHTKGMHTHTKKKEVVVVAVVVVAVAVVAVVVAVAVVAVVAVVVAVVAVVAIVAVVAVVAAVAVVEVSSLFTKCCFFLNVCPFLLGLSPWDLQHQI